MSGLELHSVAEHSNGLSLNLNLDKSKQAKRPETLNKECHHKVGCFLVCRSISTRIRCTT
jgi:hypothetical protein